MQQHSHHPSRRSMRGRPRLRRNDLWLACLLQRIGKMRRIRSDVHCGRWNSRRVLGSLCFWYVAVSRQNGCLLTKYTRNVRRWNLPGSGSKSWSRHPCETSNQQAAHLWRTMSWKLRALFHQSRRLRGERLSECAAFRSLTIAVVRRNPNGY
jgi:hypothetical protein